MSSTNWRAEWMTKKLAIARSLYQGECGGTYGEAVIITCAAISALAVEVWPGDRIDRKRFIELLVTLTGDEHEARRVSVPLLIAGMKKKGQDAQVRCLEQRFLRRDVSEVVTGQDIDRLEQEILEACPGIPLPDVRNCSYAAILYEQLRCGYIHQYQPGPAAKSWRMTERDAAVSYVNWVETPNEPPERHIYFHPEWLFLLAGAAAEAVDEAGNLPREWPAEWWIEQIA